MKINKIYMGIFLILVVVEVMIALFVHDTIIRPYIGDVLIVFLMYSFIRGIVEKQIKLLPLYLFIFSTLVELAQYFQIVKMLNLQENKLFSIIIGARFDIKDILCYLVASIVLFVWEKMDKNEKNKY
ncbi:MAG: hypothetical protein A2Y24_06110 [Clostridiales bacterium GWE2_32_10]|nr:MAG: hypothetical protein A2Y24_06110 [Clostridiales bacterium GWE2_32_10]HBY21542.1 DUF2809 domain-containing protein [Clostridiales bacterium]